MSIIISTTTKRTPGVEAAKAVAKRPRLLITSARVGRPVGKLGLKASKPIIKRRARRRVDQLGEAAQQLSEAVRTAGQVLAVDGPAVAYALDSPSRQSPSALLPGSQWESSSGRAPCTSSRRSTARRWRSS